MKLSVFYNHISEAAKQTSRSAEDVAKEVRSFGISSVEIMESDIAENKQDVINVLKSAGLSVNCLCCFRDFGNNPDMSEAKSAVDLAKEIGSPKVLIIPGFLSDGDDKEAHLANMKKVLKEMCDYAESQGIIVGMEDFDDKTSPFSTIEGLKWYMDNIPQLSCMFDTGNFIYSEEDALKAFDVFESKIKHGVHCKDRTFNVCEGEEYKETVSGRKMYPSPVGEGCIPIKEIVTRLINSGFKGSFTIEHFGALNQLLYMKKSAQWMLDLEKQLL